MGILRDLRNTKQVEAARTVIKFHGDIANSLLTDAVSLAHDIPETAGTREAILFILKRVAPSTASSIRNFSVWVNEEVASQMQEPPEAAPAEEVEFTNVRNIVGTAKSPRIRPRKRDGLSH
jgi:hypothetical protein